MNIQQFQYVLAVEKVRHFETAADMCCVTQSTLSTMINRLEDELGIKIFNRKTKPVSVTQEGQVIVERLRIIQKEIEVLTTVVQELKGEMVGELRIGIIPTIAPDLLPLFLSVFAARFPKVKVIVQELTTQTIQTALKQRTLDVGILATPLLDTDLVEYDLYEEPFLVYNCADAPNHQVINPQELDYTKLWLLEEGHCLRTQVQNICDLSHREEHKALNIEFKAGSLGSLIQFTKANAGMTILPYLATLSLPEAEREKLVPFASPTPVRTIGLVTHTYFVKQQLLEELKQVIQTVVAPLIPRTSLAKVLNPK